eukprot:Sspe_Gene.25503::Locus_10267_Transcript_1_1_Confidence_1.000_Length_2230::g.25503::m.25503
MVAGTTPDTLDDDYDRVLEYAASQQDALSDRDDVLSLASSGRSHPRRRAAACHVTVMSCEIAGQGSYRLEVTHDKRCVLDTGAKGCTPEGVVHWDGASFLLATAINSRNKLSPPLRLVFQLSEALTQSVIVRNTVVLDEYRTTSRKGRVLLGGCVRCTIEVSFTEVPSLLRSPPPEDPPTLLKRCQSDVLVEDPADKDHRTRVAPCPHPALCEGCTLL